MKKTIGRILKLLLVLFAILNVIVFCHAYKFTHFYEPGEVEVKAASDKTGWDKTKELLFGFNAVKQQNTKPDTVFNTIFFTTKTGLKLEAWEFDIDSAKGTVALFHGHGGKKSSLLQEAAVFRKLGYNTILLDFRAHGNSQGNTCTIGYKEAEDVKLVYDYLEAKGEKNIVLYGISLGAATISKAIYDYKLKPAKVILDMPFAALNTAVTGRLKMMQLPPQPLGTMLTFWGGIQNGFWAFNLKPYIYVRSINCPVLLQRGKNDPRVTQEETQLIYENIHSSKKLVIYNNAAHESLCNKENEKWVAEVTAFLQ